MKLPKPRPYVLLAVSAVLLAFAFPTFHWFPLVWVALIPLIALSWNATPAEAARKFFFTGWLFHTILLQWLAANIFWAGGWALLGQQALCVLLALFWALLGAAWVWSRARLPRVPPALLLALLWFAMEWLHAICFTGFGWSALGYTQGPDLYFLQWAAIGGVSLLSFVIVLVNALTAQALIHRVRRWPALLAAVTVIALAHAIGALLLKPSPPPAFNVGLYQSNYSQEMKYDTVFLETMIEMAAEHSAYLAQAEKVDLFVWPEALVMQDFNRPEVLRLLAALAQDTGIPLFTGAVRIGENNEDFNSSVLITPGGQAAAWYDKVHLAPFGEYIPLHLPFLDNVVPGAGVEHGEAQTVIPLNGSQLGPLICFEVLFTGLANELREMGATTLVVITNLGWFGASNAVAQELEIARLRAVETRLPLIHSANTGISGAFDPYGRFTVINGIMMGDHYYKWPDGRLTPRQAFLQRMIGALPVTAPAKPVLPGGPVLMPWLALGISIAVLLAAAVLPRLRRQDPQP